MALEREFELENDKKFKIEKAKHDTLKFALLNIIANQYTQSGFDEKEALICVIKYAKQRLEDLGTL